ncbi:PilZ domain-containing protein [Sphingomonas ginkgonis]|uniref:PilZ domain-containing protein n=1 Tax=Sphingomonas ginkgonis TaxID=2315330 RepID=A0A429V674_9SPHN|nr:PilZ domain-containing protein [Sphingomonas ginkgonis]RST29432.1 PilZ domain-containing protein [Sphingomonas ginkgonis]
MSASKRAGSTPEVESPSAAKGGSRRTAERRPLRLGSVLSDDETEILIRDLSPTGLLIETARELTIGETLVVDIPERGPSEARVVWSSGRFFGCEFRQSITSAAISAAVLQSPFERAIVDGETFDSVRQRIAAAQAEPAAADDRIPLRASVMLVTGLAVGAWTLIGLGLAWLF